MSKQIPLSQTEEQINWQSVENYLQLHFDGLPQESMMVKKFSEGYSNLTYMLRIGHWEGVLRRPPFGPLPPKAHDMEREYRILQKIHPVFPLAPKPYLYCDDPSVMDRHFYVMEKKTGVVIDDQLPPKYESEESARVLSETVVNTLVQLHTIEYKNANLADLGRPEGYLERQIYGWINRYHNSKTNEISGLDELEKWLVDNIPASSNPAIVHNDFKLNNMMFSANNPSKAIGVFDWELSTIGDPLTDLGSSLVHWAEKGDPETGLTSITTMPGFISRREFLEQYAKKSKRDVSQIDYYLTFAFYKLAAILQQIYCRWKVGQAKDERFSHLGEGIQNLMLMASRAKNKELL
jgi:aminoglycoside phosphotransferase (APT) family kinase protein